MYVVVFVFPILAALEIGLYLLYQYKVKSDFSIFINAVIYNVSLIVQFHPWVQIIYDKEKEEYVADDEPNDSQETSI